MPRRIDHDARDRIIAEAALKVLSQEGLTGLSVRNVAAEAGLAVASLRRSFPTQSSLRQFCLTLIRDRVTTRVKALEGEGTDLAIAVLEELLPLDDTRRDELLAQLQLMALAVTDPSLVPMAVSLEKDIRCACIGVVKELARVGTLRVNSTESEIAAEMHAFVDGLALHGLLDPTGASSRQIREELRGYVGRLVTQ